MKASSLYPARQGARPEWVKKMGHTPTIMDYSRFNYVAQPEDGIAAADLIPSIGPYDKWATMWGYKPIPGATYAGRREEDARRVGARSRTQTPWLRFSTPNSAGSDPGELTEAVGDADAVQSTTLGLKNLERVGGMLLTATTQAAASPTTICEDAYTRLLGQWVLEMNHVAAIVGGFDSQEKDVRPGRRAVHAGAEGAAGGGGAVPERARVPTPAFVVKPEMLRRIEPAGALDRLRTAQQRVLATLLSSARVAAAGRAEAIDGAGAYGPTDFLADVRRGIWSELGGAATGEGSTPSGATCSARMLETLAERVNGRQAASDDARALFRQELRLADDALRGASGRCVGRGHAGPHRRRPGDDRAGAGPDGPGGGASRRAAPGVG